MNDSSANEPFRSPGSAPSPYDSPTEEFPETTTSIPRTDDDLGGPPDSLPTYGRDTDLQPTYSFASIPPSANIPGEPSKSPVDSAYGRGTIDLGLLLLRLVVGGTFVYTGLQKAAGWWGGLGMRGTRTMLEHDGWKQVKVSSVLLAAGELGGGALVVLGLITPLGAAALLAVAGDAWLTVQNRQHGWAYNIPSGIVLPVVLGVAAAAIILTGPGRFGLDVGRGWSTHPRFGSLLAFVLGIAGAALAWVFLHGNNPFHA